MVYDGYQGGSVPVDAASFDVTLEPEAVVLLPGSVLDEQRAAAEALQRRDQARAARRARPRCDAGDHHAWTLTRIARNPELVVARKAAEGCVDCANTYRELARSTRRGVLARAGGLAVAGLGLSLLDVGSIARGLRGESGRRSVPTEPGRAVFIPQCCPGRA